VDQLANILLGNEAANYCVHRCDSQAMLLDQIFLTLFDIGQES